EAGGCEPVELHREQPAVCNDGRTHVPRSGHLDHVDEARVEESFTTKKTDIANSALVQDVQGATELIGVNPAQVAGRDFATGKVAEIAGCIAGVRNGDVAEGRTTAADEPQHIPSFGCNRRHGM